MEARSLAGNVVHKYNILKNSAGFAEHEYKVYDASNGHNNPEFPYRGHPEYGHPTIKWLGDLRNIKTRIDQNYTEANWGLSAEKKAKKPMVTKADLQQFLDGLSDTQE